MRDIRRIASGAVGGVVATGALLGLWLGLTDKTERWELVVGILCAATATAVAGAVLAGSGLRLALRGRWVARASAAPWWVVRDSALVLAALVARRPARGRRRAVPFRADGDAPLDVGRRAVALGLGSAGPNQYVIAESAEEGVLVVHELVATDAVTAIDLVGER